MILFSSNDDFYFGKNESTSIEHQECRNKSFFFWYYDSIGVGPTMATELFLERYCGGALGTRGSIPKSDGCAATKLYGGGFISFLRESLSTAS